MFFIPSFFDDEAAVPRSMVTSLSPPSSSTGSIRCEGDEDNGDEEAVQQESDHSDHNDGKEMHSSITSLRDSNYGS